MLKAAIKRVNKALDLFWSGAYCDSRAGDMPRVVKYTHEMDVRWKIARFIPTQKTHEREATGTFI